MLKITNFTRTPPHLDAKFTNREITEKSGGGNEPSHKKGLISISQRFWAVGASIEEPHQSAKIWPKSDILVVLYIGHTAHLSSQTQEYWPSLN